MNYKKKISILFISLLGFFIIYFLTEYSNIFNFVETFLLSILSQKEKNYFIFFTLMVFLNLFYFITPLPVFPLILLNGFVFGYYGFIFSIIFISIGSILIFSFSKYFLRENFSKVIYVKYIQSKIKKYKFIKKTNNISIFLSRYIIPYFFHNIFFGLYNLSIKNFLKIILLAEIPLTFATNNIGRSFNSFVLINDYNIFKLFFDLQFIIPFLFILLIFLISGIFKKFIVKKFN